MRIYRRVRFILVLILFICGCDYSSLKQNETEYSMSQVSPSVSKNTKEGVVEELSTKVIVEINGIVFDLILYDNVTSNEFLKKLPLTIKMNDMNGNEKYYYLNKGLTTKSVVPKKISVGDLMLFGTDCLVLFYESFNTSFSYTSLGFIENTDKLVDSLGNGSTVITFRIEEE